MATESDSGPYNLERFVVAQNAVGVRNAALDELPRTQDEPLQCPAGYSFVWSTA